MAVDNVFVELGCCLANVGLGLRTQEGSRRRVACLA